MKVYNFVIKKDSKNFYVYFKQMYPSLLTIYKKHEVYKFEYTRNVFFYSDKRL